MLVVTACQASHLSSGHSTPCWRRPLHVTTPKTRWNGFDALRHEINVADSTHRFSQFQQDASSENREVGQGDGMLWPLRSQRNGGSRERASIESRHRNALSHPVTLALTLVAPGPLWSLSAVRKRKKSMYNGTFHTTQIERPRRNSSQQGVQVFRPRQRRRLQPPRVLLRAWTCQLRCDALRGKRGIRSDHAPSTAAGKIGAMARKDNSQLK